MKEKGTVISVKGGEAVIEVMPAEACTKCCSCSASRQRRVKVGREKAPGVSPGDDVTIEIDTSSMMKIYLVIYAVPLLVFTGVLFGVYAASESSIYSFVSALVGTVITYYLISRYIKKYPLFLPSACIRKGE
jgi:positive regulator of sigma E activity